MSKLISFDGNSVNMQHSLWKIVLFTIPVFLLSEFLNLEDKSEIQKELMIKWAAVILPSIIIFIILRLLITPYPGSEYSYYELFQRVAIKIRLKRLTVGEN